MPQFLNLEMTLKRTSELWAVTYNSSRLYNMFQSIAHCILRGNDTDCLRHSKFVLKHITNIHPSIFLPALYPILSQRSRGLNTPWTCHQLINWQTHKLFSLTLTTRGKSECPADLNIHVFGLGEKTYTDTESKPGTILLWGDTVATKHVNVIFSVLCSAVVIMETIIMRCVTWSTSSTWFALKGPQSRHYTQAGREKAFL